MLDVYGGFISVEVKPGAASSLDRCGVSMCELIVLCVPSNTAVCSHGMACSCAIKCRYSRLLDL